MAIKDLINRAINKIDNFIRNWQSEFESNKTKSLNYFLSLIKTIKGEIEAPRDAVLIKKSLFSFYTFFYDSKLYHEGKLPWYDYVPLDLIIGLDSKYALGINFHYIHPLKRAQILKKLIIFYREDWFTDKPLLNPPCTWKKINNILGADKKYINFAIKKYIIKRIIKKGTQVVRIPNVDFSDNVLSLIGPKWIGERNSTEIEKQIKQINNEIIKKPY